MEYKPVPAAALISTILYGVIAWLSWQFGDDSDGVDRPILLVMSLFAAAFVVYWVATIWVHRDRVSSNGNRATLKWIIAAAVVFRVVMLFSHPIQEVDLYRYLWDGAVGGEGISPFAHSPLSIQQAITDRSETGNPTDAKERLVTLVDREPGIGQALQRVHFPELPTIYPATSQAVFTLVDVTTPSRSSLATRAFIMKAWLVGFDIATLFTLIWLLRLLGKPDTWCIAYAWCPLLMKEVAGSGHLDAIAVFFTTLTIYWLVRLMTRTSVAQKNRGRTSISLAAIGLVFAFAIGAKLYPVVLAPLLVGCVAAKFGWRHTVVPTLVSCLTTACILWPMLPTTNTNTTAPSDGVETFLKQWEMNDFLFLILIENLKPTDNLPTEQVAWFSVLPSSFRSVISDQAVSILHIHTWEAPFIVSRIVTLTIFAAIAIWLTWRATRFSKTSLPSTERFCEAAFLTLAWFWLLAPTQNPWYWTWVLPLLPFARGRAWFAVSGLVLVYYLRFWFDYHDAGSPVFGTRYHGVAFFDLVVTWFEFAPWMIFLCGGSLRLGSIRS